MALSPQKLAKKLYGREFERHGFEIKGATVTGGGHLQLTLLSIADGIEFNIVTSKSPGDWRSAMNSVRTARQQLHRLKLWNTPA